MRRVLLPLAVLLACLAPAAALAAPTVRLGAEPRAGVYAAGALWVLADRGGDRVLLEVSPRALRPTGRRVVIATGVRRDPRAQSPGTVRPSLAYADGVLLTIDPVTNVVVRVDPGTLAVARAATSEGTTLAAGPAGVWVAGGPIAEGFVHPMARIDPATLAVGDRRSTPSGLGSRSSVEIAVTRRALWVARPAASRGGLAIDLGTGPVPGVLFGPWQMYARGDTLYGTERYGCEAFVTPDTTYVGRRIVMEPDRDRCARLYARDVTGGRAGSVWVAYARGRARTGLLVQRPDDGRPGRRVTTIGPDPVDLVSAPGAVWVLDRTGRTLTRIPARPFPARAG